LRLQAEGAATLSVPDADAIAAASGAAAAADDAVELSLRISWVARKAGGGGAEQAEVEQTVVTVAVSAQGSLDSAYYDLCLLPAYYLPTTCLLPAYYLPTTISAYYSLDSAYYSLSLLWLY
jgi:hypothetical protein